MRKSIQIILGLLLTGALFSTNIDASDIIEVVPITNKVIMVHFKDGSMTYPNTLDVDRLDITEAVNTTNYSISSNDPNFGSGTNPADLGRKTKGTEYVSGSGVPYNSSVGAFDPTDMPWAAEHYIYLELANELVRDTLYTLNTGSLAANGSEWSFVYNEKEIRSEVVHVNTLGYAPDAPKYGYMYHWMGEKGGLDLSDYDGNTYWVYEKGDMSTPVKTGAIAFRKAADNVETGQSKDTPNSNFIGADVYDCDFSDIATSGTYVLVVENIGSSYPFKIGSDPVWDAYYNVMRGLYYQRSGIRLAPPYTEDEYIRPVTQNPLLTSDDGVSYAGKQFYSDFSYMDWDNDNNGGNTISHIKAAAKNNPMEVAGWYHDAGDWDGYYTHQRIPILLLTTYEYIPERYADDDLNIPESGNGVPDIVDEGSWLVKFNYRLRKELMDKGYSDGGVGGARVCSDVYNSEDGSAEQDGLPSWKEYRRMVITQADAFMTYLYAGQAAQLAIILKKVGKDPTAWPVELLDAVEFSEMSYDTVDWIQEAKEAFDWASAEENQPHSGNNYASPLSSYRSYAAANLYRLTGESAYHTITKADLAGLTSQTSLDDDDGWGVFSYVLADNFNRDEDLHAALTQVMLNTANTKGADNVNDRACRWGNLWYFPMLVGQGSTPMMFENILAYSITDDALYRNTIHTTADYFLGSNPLHTTWITGVGPRGLHAVFHLDSRHITENWATYPGQIPYGPWSEEYGYDDRYTWEIDGVDIEGGHGPWHFAWFNFTTYPVAATWPGHERLTYNIHSPIAMEFTIHQNSVHGGLVYGFVNNRVNTNSGSDKSISTLSLNESSITFTKKKESALLVATPDIEDATYAHLLWESSDEAVAHVDAFGRVTAMGDGTCSIACKTEDGDITTECAITCDNLADVAVDSISVDPKQVNLDEGENQGLLVSVFPENATNKTYAWHSTDSAVAIVVDDELKALAAGSAKLYVVADENDLISDTVLVNVLGSAYYVLADFDEVIPALDGVKPDVSHMFGGGTLDIAASNPDSDAVNSSDMVAQFDKDPGTWKLIGIIPPSENMPDVSKYDEFQVMYYGSGINQLWVRATMEDNSEHGEWYTIAGEDKWNMVALALPESGNLSNIHIFMNPNEDLAFTSYWDNFRLREKSNSIESISIEGDPVRYMVNGDMIQLNAVVSPEDVLDKEIVWSSDDPDVAFVSADGKLLAVSTGITNVYASAASDPSIQAFIEVHVEIPLEKISISGDSLISMTAGNTQKLNIFYTPSDATNRTINWESENESIASISDNGTITAVSEGVTGITATSDADNSLTDRVEVTVGPASISFEDDAAFTVFPNPAKDQLTIVSDEVIHALEISDLYGRIVLKTDAINQREVTIELESLKPGMYLLKAELSENQTANQVIVVGE